MDSYHQGEGSPAPAVPEEVHDAPQSPADGALFGARKVKTDTARPTERTTRMETVVGAPRTKPAAPQDELRFAPPRETREAPKVEGEFSFPARRTQRQAPQEAAPMVFPGEKEKSEKEKEERPRVIRPEDYFQNAGAQAPAPAETAPKQSRWPLIATVAVLLVALLVIGVMLIPENDDGVLGNIRRGVTGVGASKSETTPTAVPAAEASSFYGAPTVGPAPMTVVFNLTTSGQVEDVRLVDSDGVPLTTTGQRTDNTGFTIWTISCTFTEAYTGPVTAMLLSGGEWTDTRQSVNVQVSQPVTTAAPLTPVASTAVEVYSFTASTTRSGTAPFSIIFQATTSTAVQDVRLVRDDGEELDARANLLMETDRDRTWQINWLAETAYSGGVHVELSDGENWQPTESVIAVEIAGLTPTPTATAVPTETPAEEAAVPEETQAEEAEALPAEDWDSQGDPSAAEEGAEENGEPLEEMAGNLPEAPGLEEGAEPAAEDVDVGALIHLGGDPNAQDPAEEAPEEAADAEDTEEEAEEEKRPRLTAEAAVGADPALIKTQSVYVGSSKKTTENYDRDLKKLVNFGTADEYTQIPLGMLAFRGSNFRQNASYGNVKTLPNAMDVLWTVDMGSVKGNGKTVYYGMERSQAIIVKWTKEIRETSSLNEEKKDVSPLREVIVAGNDGVIYFLDLTDGKATRKAINLGYPMRGTPAASSRGMPFLAVGQYARKMASGTGKTGLRMYDLMTMKSIDMIDGLDGKLNRPLNEIGYFDTGAVIDRVSDTLVTAGTNGALYLVSLGTKFPMPSGPFSTSLDTVMLVSRAKDEKVAHTAVESSLAAFQQYVFYADMGGYLRCVDTDRLSTVWAVPTGDAVESAVALDLDAENNLWLYTANTLQNRSKGDCQIRRYNAMSGEEQWTAAFNVAKPKNNPYIAGAIASPVIGTGSLQGLVYYAVSGLTANGAEAAGLEKAATAGALIALNAESGEVVWSRKLDTWTYSSPVAVYDGEGRGCIIQCSHSGLLTIYDGLTGEEINTLQLDGKVTASPAVYKDILIIGTTGKGTSHIYAVVLSAAQE